MTNTWMVVYRLARDLLITISALVLLAVEVLHEARTEVLILIASMLSVPTFLRSSGAIKSAENGGGR